MDQRIRTFQTALAVLWTATAIVAGSQKPTSGAPSAIAILAKAQHALGGRAELDRIRTLRRRLELRQDPGGRTAEQTLEVVFPNASKLTNHVGSLNIAAFSGDGGGWVSMPMGIDDLPPWQARAARQEILRLLESLVLSDHIEGRTVEHAGEAVVRTRKVQGVKVTTPPSVSVTLWVDSASGDPVKLDYARVTPSGAPGMPVSEFYEDFRPEGKLRVPHVIVSEEGGMPYMRARLLKVEYNASLSVEELSRRPAVPPVPAAQPDR